MPNAGSDVWVSGIIAGSGRANALLTSAISSNKVIVVPSFRCWYFQLKFVINMELCPFRNCVIPLAIVIPRSRSSCMFPSTLS